MNYRHAFHAGNFCDVVKHCILIMLLQSFQSKDKAFCYLDSHAGSGLYDLNSTESSKTLEWQQGIAKLQGIANAPEIVEKYLNLIKQCEANTYPGSPYIAKLLLRAQDRMVLCELHPEECQKLKSVFCHDKNVAIHQQDAYLGLKAFLPPKEKRGLILIDPPFEQADEFEKILRGLKTALAKFENGCYAIWYPLKNRMQVKKFHRELKLLKAEGLIAELSILPENDAQLYGSGMIIINPPWQFEDKLNALLPWLWQHLSIQNQGHYQVSRLNAAP